MRNLYSHSLEVVDEVNYLINSLHYVNQDFNHVIQKIIF